MRAKLADESLMFAALPRRAPAPPIMRAEAEPITPPSSTVVTEKPRQSTPPRSVEPAVTRRPALRVQPVATVAAPRPLHAVTLATFDAPEITVAAPIAVSSKPADPSKLFDRSVVPLLLVLTAAGGAVYLRRLTSAP
jgi:hypothetical protein